MRVYVNLLQKKSNTSFYAKIDKDLTFLNQNIVKNTINDLTAKQELPDTAKYLTIPTPRTLCTYFLTKFHKPSNPGRPIVSICCCPTELISIYFQLFRQNYGTSRPNVTILH